MTSVILGTLAAAGLALLVFVWANSHDCHVTPVEGSLVLISVDCSLN